MADNVQIEWGTKRTQFLPLTLKNGTTTTDAIDLMGWTLDGVASPAGGFAGALTIQASDKVDGTYLPAKDDGGTALAITAVAGVYVVLSEAALWKMRGLRYVKLTFADPGADKAITLVTIGF